MKIFHELSVIKLFSLFFFKLGFPQKFHEKSFVFLMKNSRIVS
jgi:hypothetical protein